MNETPVERLVGTAEARRSRPLNRTVKSWPGWLLMLLVAIVFLAVGATRSSGPQTQSDRVDDLTRRIACPVCDGESVFESQNSSSRSIRTEVDALVRENELSDDDILERINRNFEGELLLVPRSTGLDALVWILPVVGFVAGLAGLTVAFRRWKLDAAEVGDPTGDDRALVAAALELEDGDPDRAPE
jgi:cytochrome c-type biogenesis protein CcmH